MLRSLIIRQVFVVIDLVLALLVAGVAWLVIAKALAKEAAPPPRSAEAGAADQVLTLREPGPRESYEAINKSGLFGDAATQSSDAKPPDAPPNLPPEVTKLPLKLLGTAASAPTAPTSTATIENETSRSQAVYYIGDTILPGVTLAEVHKRKTLLQNNGKPEWLSMDEEEAAVPGPLASLTPTVVPGGGQKITMKKEELMKELTVNYVDILQTLSPEPHKGANGKVDGYTSKNVSKVPLAKKLGLQDNDVVQQINGVAIDSQEKIFEVANKFQDQKTFRLTIQRGGRTQMITYNLE